MTQFEIMIIELNKLVQNKLHSLIIASGIVFKHNNKTISENNAQIFDNLKEEDEELYLIYFDYFNEQIDSIQFECKIKEYIKKLNESLKNCINLSNKYVLYIEFCTFIVYEKTFYNRFQDLNTKFPDYNIEKFIEEEYHKIYNQDYISEFLDKDNRISLELSQNKKLKFLEELAKEKGFQFRDELQFDDFFEKFQKLENDFNLVKLEDNENIDFVNNSTLNDKIIILDQLGFFELIKAKSKTISGNKISKLLESLIDEKHSSITPLVNRLLQPHQIYDNRHPYYSAKSTEKVKDLFTKIGLGFIDKSK